MKLTSAVQSLTGELAALDAVIESASEHDALVIVDATQACGWLLIDAGRIDCSRAAPTSGSAQRVGPRS